MIQIADIPSNYLKKFSNAELNKILKSSVKTANSRLARLQRNNYQQGMKSDTYVNRYHALTHGSEYGTASGKFSGRTINDREKLIEHIKEIQKFNSLDTTSIKGIKKANEETVARIFNTKKPTKNQIRSYETILKMQFLGYDIPIEFGSPIYRVVENRLNSGEDIEDVVRDLETAIVDGQNDPIEAFSKFSLYGELL